MEPDPSLDCGLPAPTSAVFTATVAVEGSTGVAAPVDVETVSGAGSSEAVALSPAADVDEVEAAGLASWRRGVLPAAGGASLLVGSGATLSSESEVLSVWVPRPERRAGSLGSADDAVEAGESEVAAESEASVEVEEFEEAEESGVSEESEESEVVEL